MPTGSQLTLSPNVSSPYSPNEKKSGNPTIIDDFFGQSKDKKAKKLQVFDTLHPTDGLEDHGVKLEKYATKRHD